MTTYHVNLPDTAKEIDAPSASKQFIKLYKMRDSLWARGIEAEVVDGRRLHQYPGYICTHYMTNPLGILCLIRR